MVYKTTAIEQIQLVAKMPKRVNQEIAETDAKVEKLEPPAKEDIKAEVKDEPEDIKPESSTKTEATEKSQKSSDVKEESEDDSDKPINTRRFWSRFLDIHYGLSNLILDMKESPNTLLRNIDCTDPTCMPDRSEESGCCKSCLGNDRYFYKVFLNEADKILEEAAEGLHLFKG